MYTILCIVFLFGNEICVENTLFHLTNALIHQVFCQMWSTCLNNDLKCNIFCTILIIYLKFVFSLYSSTQWPANGCRSKSDRVTETSSCMEGKTLVSKQEILR